MAIEIATWNALIMVFARVLDRPDHASVSARLATPGKANFAKKKLAQGVTVTVLAMDSATLRNKNARARVVGFLLTARSRPARDPHHVVEIIEANASNSGWLIRASCRRLRTLSLRLVSLERSASASLGSLAQYVKSAVCMEPLSTRPLDANVILAGAGKVAMSSAAIRDRAVVA
jgi:hypothetical protein